MITLTSPADGDVLEFEFKDFVGYPSSVGFLENEHREYDCDFRFSLMALKDRAHTDIITNRQGASYFVDKDCVDKSGLPSEVIDYCRPGGHRHYHLNPVDHVTVEGNISLDYNPEDLPRSSRLLGLENFFSHRVDTLGIVPVGCPHNEFHIIEGATLPYSEDVEDKMIFFYGCYGQYVDIESIERFSIRPTFYSMMAGTASFNRRKDPISGNWGPWRLSHNLSFKPLCVFVTYDKDNGSNVAYVQQWRKDITGVPSGWLKTTTEDRIRSAFDFSKSELATAMEMYHERRWGSTRAFKHLHGSSVPLRKYKLDQLRTTLCSTNWSQYFEPVREHRGTLWNELCFDALNSLEEGFNGNGVAYIKDLLGITEAFRSTFNTIRKLPSSKARGIASAYLSVHYGYKLMYLDTLELAKSLREINVAYNLSDCRASEEDQIEYSDQVFAREFRYQLKYDPYRNLSGSLDEFTRFLDLHFSLTNWWDMVPYSFVIDWFTHFGDFLTAIDNFYGVRAYYHTVGAIQSIKSTCRHFDGSRLGFNLVTTGRLRVEAYQRRVSRYPVIPLPGKHSLTGLLQHVVEGAALIVNGFK